MRLSNVELRNTELSRRLEPMRAFLVWIEQHEWVLLSLTIGFVALYTSFFAFFHVDPHHDGVLLIPALDVVAGRRLFAETFTQYGALTTYIHSAAMLIGGPTLLALRLSAIPFYLVTTWFFIQLGKKILPTWLTYVGVGIWMLTAYFPNRLVMVPFLAWSSVYALTFQMATVFCIERFLTTKSNRFLCVAGICIGLTFWARQPVGIFLFGATIFLWCIRLLATRSKQVFDELGVLLIGVILACVPFAIGLIATHSVAAWWQQSMVLAFDFGQRLSGSFRFGPLFSQLFPSPLHDLKNLWWNLLPLTTVGVTIHALHTFVTRPTIRNEQTYRLLSLGLICLASWLQYFPGSDHSHVFWAATPMLIMLLYACVQLHRLLRVSITQRQWKGLSKSFPFFLVALGCFLLLLPFVRTTASGLKYYLTTPFVSRPEAVFAGLRLDPVEAAVYERLDQRLQVFMDAYPQQYLLNLSPDAVYSVYPPVKRIHIMPMYWDWASETLYPTYTSDSLAAIRRDRPMVLVRDPLRDQHNQPSILSSYCEIDLAAHDFVRTQMYLRPLRLLVPAENLFKVQTTAFRVQITSVLSDITMTQVSTQQGNVSIALPVQIEKGHTLSFPRPINTIALTFSSELFGNCALDLPVL